VKFLEQNAIPRLPELLKKHARMKKKGGKRSKSKRRRRERKQRKQRKRRITSSQPGTLSLPCRRCSVESVTGIAMRN